MRFFLIVLFLIIYYIFSIPMWIIGFIIGLQDKDARHRFAQPFVNIGFKGIMFIGGIKLTVIGKENQPEGAALYTFNHRSFFDIITSYTTAPPLTLFISKASVMKAPLLGRWMRYMHCLGLDRGNLKQGMETINKGIELLKSGHNIFVAPEGTRAKTDELLEFHEATFRLATKSKVPIVPVAMINTSHAFEDHLPWVKKTHIVLEYLEPIDVASMERSEQKHIGATVREILQNKVNENLKLYEEGKFD